MGCVSSKLVKKEVIREIRLNCGGDHIVSLTSTTYGLLKLDKEQAQQQEPIKEVVAETKKLQRSPSREEPEIINAWELMEDLEEGVSTSNLEKISPKVRAFMGKSKMSPFKLVDKIHSPKKGKRFGGKENTGSVNGLNSNENRGLTPKQILKPKNLLETPKKGVLRLSFPLKTDESVLYTQRRRSLNPLFDPDLVASYARELCNEQEQIKMIISPAKEIRKPTKTQESEKIIQNFEEKCPPGGENSVVIYTTTLRGIRKTFEDCNTVRSIIESHQIHVSERDVSLHSGFKDDIRGIMGTKEVKVPIVFIKGRLIGGVDEIVKLEEKAKLGILLEGMPRGLPGGCQGCGGMRFLMCMECNGSCKAMDEEQKKIVKCGQCNENGLILCPICC